MRRWTRILVACALALWMRSACPGRVSSQDFPLRVAAVDLDEGGTCAPSADDKIEAEAKACMHALNERLNSLALTFLAINLGCALGLIDEGTCNEFYALMKAIPELLKKMQDAAKNCDWIYARGMCETIHNLLTKLEKAITGGKPLKTQESGGVPAPKQGGP